MVNYAAMGLANGQSIEVTYWSEYYDLEINIDWNDNTVEAITPLINWKQSGF